MSTLSHRVMPMIESNLHLDPIVPMIKIAQSPGIFCIWSVRAFAVRLDLRQLKRNLAAKLFRKLFRTAFKLRNPAVVLPKFNVVTIDHLPGVFAGGFVVIADEIDGFHEMTVTANKVGSIVRHDLRSLTPSVTENCRGPTAIGKLAPKARSRSI
jgi:hypothetical protein